MQVILTKEILGLGDPGQTVKVKDGYARNYLIPQGFALEATKRNMAAIEAERKRIAARQAKEAEQVRDQADKINGAAVVIPVRAGEQGKLYGSVSTKDISEALEALGHEIDRRRILLDQPIKDLGVYNLKVKLHPQVFVDIKVEVQALVEKTEDEAAPEAEAVEEQVEAVEEQVEEDQIEE